MGVTRYVNMSFVAIGLISWIILADTAGFMLDVFGTGWNRPLIGVNFRMADLIGLVTAILFTIWLRRHERVSTYAMEVGNELSKVKWPTWNETKLATIVVIITTIIISLILGGFDYVWSALSGLIYEI